MDRLMKSAAITALAAAVTLIGSVVAKAAEPAVQWSGVYVGAGVGYGASNTNVDIGATGFGSVAVIDGLGASGAALTLTIGADLKFDRFLIGAFLDWTRHDQDWSISSSLIPGGTLARMEFDNQWTIGGRAGVVLGSSLVYGLVGYTTLHTSDLAVPAAALTVGVPDFKGWSLGGGIEMALGNGLFLGAEYRFTQFDKETATLALGPGITIGLEPEVHQATARLMYKLGVDAFGK